MPAQEGLCPGTLHVIMVSTIVVLASLDEQLEGVFLQDYILHSQRIVTTEVYPLSDDDF